MNVDEAQMIEQPAVEVAIKKVDRATELFPDTFVNISGSVNVNLLVGNVEASGWSGIDKQYGIMKGEWDELTKNVAERNYTDLADDIGDMLFTLIGFANAAGMARDMGENFYRICGAQLSKFDNNLTDANLTIDKYTKKGMQVHLETAEMNGVVYYITKSSIEQIDPGRNELIKAGKWLKSHRFNEPPMVMPSAEVQAKFTL